MLLLSQGGLALPPTQGLCPALLGTHRSEAQGSHVFTGPSFHTHISVPVLLRPSERRRPYLIQPQSAWPQLGAQEPHTPRDGNLTSGPNLPVTKSSSYEKQRRPLRTSPGTQVQRASNFASSHRGAMSARQIPELRAVPGTSCASKVRKVAGLVSRCARLSYPRGPEDVKVRLRKLVGRASPLSPSKRE